MTTILYPGQTAGSPVALQGELYWNFGLAAVALGALLIGALMGVLGRAGLAPRGPTALLVYAVLTASVACAADARARADGDEHRDGRARGAARQRRAQPDDGHARDRGVGPLARRNADGP